MTWMFLDDPSLELPVVEIEDSQICGMIPVAEAVAKEVGLVGKDAAQQEKSRVLMEYIARYYDRT